MGLRGIKPDVVLGLGGIKLGIKSDDVMRLRGIKPDIVIGLERNQTRCCHGVRRE